MKVGMFQPPFIGPDKTPKQVFDWSVRQAVVADQAGFSEYWVGEHATMQWEGIPSPELVLAAAAQQTKQIKLGPLGHLLPYHHPATLAAQTAWLSHILEGRYQMGMAPGAYPTDAQFHGITDMSENPKRMMEALKIMEMIWKNEPFHYKGNYWEVTLPESSPQHPIRDQSPWGGAIPLALTALSENSPTIRFAGSRGYIPASVYTSTSVLRSHFDTYAAAAAEAGLSVGREMHRVVREIVVADTDAEARKLAIEGGMGRSWGEYMVPAYHAFGLFERLVEGRAMSLSDVTPEFLADNLWVVGSPETVAEKLDKWFDEIGGKFGTLLIYSHDYMDDPTPWEESMQRITKEVLPRINASEPVEAVA